MTHTAIPDARAVHEAEARIRPYLSETPLLQVPDLDAVMGAPLHLKLESLQRTGSFKARGALNWVLTAEPEELHQGLVTVSAGNHALALAWAAAMREVPLTVVMPAGSSPLKVRGTEALGAKVIVQGTIQEAVAHCHRLRDESGLTLVHPYDDPRVMAGQGTVGLELLRQGPDIGRVLCPIGGGGLISGLGLALKAARPGIELIGVEPAGAPTMRHAWDCQDAAAALDRVDTWAASLAPAAVGENTYAASRKVVDDILTVSEASIRQATRHLLSSGHLLVEPGAAVGLAALIEHRFPAATGDTVLVLTGANLDLDQVDRCLTD
ncbi:threonine/serine dehydratase [Marinobacter halodurans]|uniref:Threonine/serine dehydratase n=1 Tax=Marinobacter halodurans TaxID=2528979 RepID=A0ABY1ZM69_9GAMM|nr:threonine/serine dehydratase [Marinobacter halodurans]TBW55455.1 threonine/serine dehydratase [Marinobacter halodurans]